MNFFYFLPVVIVLPFLHQLWREYVEEKRVKEMERLLPSVLSKFSTLPRGVSFNNALEIFSNSSDPLSKEFRKAGEKINRGYPAEMAIRSMDVGTSVLLAQAKRMLVQFYKNGFPTSHALKELAEEITELQELQRDAEAGASLQKYSLLVSSSFLSPLIIALLYSVARQASSMLSFLGTTSTALQEAVFYSAAAYLVIFCFLSSLFIARQVGKSKSFIAYFLTSASLALMVFALVTTAASNVF